MGRGTGCRRTLAWLTLLAAAAAGAPAQDPETGFHEEVSVGYVLVPVAVRSRDGYVTDLGPEDFHLWVDGRPVAFESFERGSEVPVSQAFLQDLSGSMALGGKLDVSRQAIECLLDRSRPHDRFAAATFAGHRLEVDVPFTGDPEPIRQAMQAWRGYGVTALNDAVARLPEIAPSRTNPNVAAILITDGVENASGLPPERARELVRRARIPVYVFGLARVERGDGLGGRGRPYARLLRELAEATGGRYLSVADVHAAVDACVEVALELRSRYVLGFTPANSGPVGYRELRVEVAGRGLRVSHRRGYQGRLPGSMR